MTLYYSTGACSLSPRIVAEELGLKLNFVRVDLRTKLTEASEDYTKIVKKGAVPALALDNGEILTEGPAIVQYIGGKRTTWMNNAASGVLLDIDARSGVISSPNNFASTRPLPEGILRISVLADHARWVALGEDEYRRAKEEAATAAAEAMTLARRSVKSASEMTSWTKPRKFWG